MLRSSSAMQGIVQSLHGRSTSLTIVSLCGHPATTFLAVDDVGIVRSSTRGMNILRCSMHDVDTMLRRCVGEGWGKTYISTYAAAQLQDDGEGAPVDHKSTVHRIGGSFMLHETLNDRCVLACTGSTVHLCVRAQKELETLGIHVSVLDVYCLCPLDRWALLGPVWKDRVPHRCRRGLSKRWTGERHRRGCASVSCNRGHFRSCPLHRPHHTGTNCR